MKALGKTAILNRVFNRDTDALKVELGNDENGPLLTSENPASVVLRGNDGSITDLNYIPVKVSASTDPSVAFANNDVANTQKTITLTKPSGTIKKYHRLVFHNPSTETDLTVKVFNKNAIGVETKQFMGSFIVNAKATVTGTNIETDARTILRDLFLGGSDVELVISNNQVIGGAGAFTGTVQVYAL